MRFRAPGEPVRIYLAGPLFTLAERAFNVHLRNALQVQGYEVWLPQENEPREATAKGIFEMDVKGIDWCDMILANMDGPDPDSGTCWEVGYAYGTNRSIPIVSFRTDFRGAGESGLTSYNIMPHESVHAKVSASSLEIASVGQLIDRLVPVLKEVERVSL